MLFSTFALSIVTGFVAFAYAWYVVGRKVDLFAIVLGGLFCAVLWFELVYLMPENDRLGFVWTIIIASALGTHWDWIRVKIRQMFPF